MNFDGGGGQKQHPSPVQPSALHFNSFLSET